MIIMNRRSAGGASTTGKRLTEVLSQYWADDGALTKTQLSQVKKAAPKVKAGTLRTSLLEREST